MIWTQNHTEITDSTSNPSQNESKQKTLLLFYMNYHPGFNQHINESICSKVAQEAAWRVMLTTYDLKRWRRLKICPTSSTGSAINDDVTFSGELTGLKVGRSNILRS